MQVSHVPEAANRLPTVEKHAHCASSWRLPLALTALCLGILAGFLLLPAAARADGPGDVTVTMAPGSTGPQGLALRTQTVDATISQAGDGMWAETRVWVRLANPGTQPITASLALPGPQLITGTLPSDLTLTADDRPLSLTINNGATAQVRIPPKGEVSLKASYRQRLRESNGQVVYAYPIASSAVWAGRPDSLRVTVRFAGLLTAEQMLARSPDPSGDDGQTIEWQWEGETTQNVWLAFMGPAWWAGLESARKTSSAPSARPADLIALSRLYEQLAGLPALPFEPSPDMATRYYPASVGALQTAVTLSKDGAKSVADEILAHTGLARLYRRQADVLGPAGSVYLELAATEAQAAVELGANDAALRTLAIEAYERLAAESQAQGDRSMAEAYLAKQAAISGTSQGQNDADAARSARLQMAAQRAMLGDLEVARQIVVEMAGPTGTRPPGLRPPMAAQSYLLVETQSDSRRLTLILNGARDVRMLGNALGRAAESLRTVAGVEVSVGADRIEVVIPHGPGDPALASLQARLATALSSDPEYALLSAALSSDHTELAAAETPYRQETTYRQWLDLRAARVTWETHAEGLAAAAYQAAALQGQDFEARLAPVQRLLWAADAAGWRDLAATSYAEYRVALEDTVEPRQWQVRPDEPRTLVTRHAEWRLDMLALMATSAAASLALVAWVIWRWL